MTPTMLARRPLSALAAVLLIVLAGCGGNEPAAPTSGASSAASSAPAAPITVFAAASLTEAFTEIGTAFQAESGSTVTFNFGSSATLATQINQGAPADVFAAASPATMKTVTDAGNATGPVNFVSNTLQIAVPTGNPGKITGLEDFADESKRIAICAPQVPCGAAAEKVFAAAKITPKPDTLEQDVKAALTKVAADEVDAALVYRTDVISAPEKVEGIDFPEAGQAVNQYPIATCDARARTRTWPRRSWTTCCRPRARPCWRRRALPSRGAEASARTLTDRDGPRPWRSRTPLLLAASRGDRARLPAAAPGRVARSGPPGLTPGVCSAARRRCWHCGCRWSPRPSRW